MADLDPRIRDKQPRDGHRPGRDRSHADDYSTGRPARGRDVWRASASFGWLIGTLLLLLAGAGIVLLLLRVPGSSGGQRVAWIAIIAALTALTVGIAVLLRALPTMRYRFEGDALVIEWFSQKRVVSLAEITDITYEPAAPLKLPGWEPFWPGYYVATVRTPTGTWHSWATQQPRRRVRLTTASGVVAISPERPVRFIAELERRRRAAGDVAAVANPPLDSVPTLPPSNDTSLNVSTVSPDERMPPQEAPPEPRPSNRASQQRHATPAARHRIGNWALAFRDLFRDQLLMDQVASALVAAGVVLPVLMVAYLYSQYESLPDQIPIRWDASGEVAELTTPGGLWRFPRIAVVVLVINTCLATLLIGIDRYLSRLLVAAIPLAQLILFVALVRAVN